MVELISKNLRFSLKVIDHGISYKGNNMVSISSGHMVCMRAANPSGVIRFIIASKVVRCFFAVLLVEIVEQFFHFLILQVIDDEFSFPLFSEISGKGKNLQLL